MDLGLLPVPLYAGDPRRRYVLLNGTRGSFCLDLEADGAVDPRSTAWSANVGHYVSIIGAEVRVHRWSTSSTSQDRFQASSVFGALDAFHQYLEADAPELAQSAIAHAIRVFRSLRTAVGPGYGGSDALGAYLALLACGIEVEERRPGELAQPLADRWRLPGNAIAIARTIRSDDWQNLLRELRSGRTIEKLPLNVRLLLRHASGTLFQEAHYEAVFHDQAQLSLGLFPPTPAAVSRAATGVGLHFTPPALVRTLVEEALRIIDTTQKDVTIFDPACGSGEFLREALRQISARDTRRRVHLIGWDISPAACAMARFALACESASAWIATVDIVCQDSVLTPWPTGVDAILMNPPFAAWPDISEEHKVAIRQLLGESYKHRPDLATFFAISAVGALSPGGVLSTVLPASFLDATSLQDVRRDLADDICLAMACRLGSHDIFPGAKIDAAMLVGVRERRLEQPPLAVWADARSASMSSALRALRRIRAAGGTVNPVDQGRFSIYPVEDLGTDATTWAPRPYRAWGLLKQLESRAMAGMVFSVKQGALTGLNRAFVLTPDECSALPSGERDYFRPAVLNDSITDGRLVLTGMVFYPYGRSRQLSNEMALRKRLPTYFATKLRAFRAGLEKRAGIERERWWELTRPRRWQEARRPKIVSTYFGAAGSFAWDSRGEFVALQGYGWIPKGKAVDFSESLWLAYTALLNSELFSVLLSAVSNHVGGGQWNLSKRFVERVPLPDLRGPTINPTLIAQLADIGRQLNDFGASALSSSDRLAWRELAETAYGVTVAS